MNQQGGYGGPPPGQPPHGGYPPQYYPPQYYPPQHVAHPGHPQYPGGHQHYAHPGPFVRAQYEFSPHENKIVADLAFWSGGLGVVKLVHGALSLVVANIFGFLLHLAVGLLMLYANRSLAKVVTTEGNDIDHLLKSVDHLATVFQIRLILTLMVTILVGIVAVVALST